MFYSLIIPVYNRPDHIQSLLECLVDQEYKDFEVLVVESGSSIKSDEVVASFKDLLNISYHYKGNDGQGFSRNYGMARAKGEYFVILDSDILLDSDYLSNLDRRLKEDFLDAYGGPDKLHPASSPTQKAVNYVMTSFLTTGGTRGGKKQVGKYYPRSFDMGISREVYDATKGYKLPFMGEDIELSKRIMSLGYKIGFIPDVHVYHERKDSLKKFYKQMHWFGRSRVNIFSHFPDTLKPIHFLPLAFTAYVLLLLILLVMNGAWAFLAGIPLLIYMALIFTDSTILFRSPLIGLQCVAGTFVLMTAYSHGFLEQFWNQIILKKPPF
jgi:glycosyltransferase involved in cell wall biosynthesis